MIPEKRRDEFMVAGRMEALKEKLTSLLLIIFRLI